MVTFLLEGLVFALIGLQLPSVVAALGNDARQAVVTAVAVTVTVVVVRFLWLFPATYLPRRLSARVRRKDPAPPWQFVVVIGWAGMRGVVSLAAAFALPLELPGRELVLFVTFCVIIATLLLQGLSLPWVVRRLDLDDAGAAERTDRAIATADHHVARVALQELERLVDEQPVTDAVADELRHHLEERVRHAHAVLGGCPGEDEYDDGASLDDGVVLTDAVTSAQVRRTLLDAERQELLRLYEGRDIDDEVLRALQRQLDVEELSLSA
jgi:CPA1 family monovalent cation:H+ antiporter